MLEQGETMIEKRDNKSRITKRDERREGKEVGTEKRNERYKGWKR